jgi:hypothetical protein
MSDIGNVTPLTHQSFLKADYKKNVETPLINAIDQLAKNTAQKVLNVTATGSVSMTDIAGYGKVRIEVDTTADNVTVTLPPAADLATAGTDINVYRSAGANTLIIDANESETINGAANISSNNAAVYSNGLNLRAVVSA